MNNILLTIESVIGSSIKSTKDERLFICPFCYHHKPKLSINFGRRIGFWKCWICNESGKRFWTLLHRLGYTVKEKRELLKDYQDSYIGRPLFEDETKYGRREKSDSDVRISLPREYKPLWKSHSGFEYPNAKKFLKGRGVTEQDIHRYQIGYCEDGLYKSRIIIPSYDNEMKLNYFVSRCYYNSSTKYKNPPASRNNIIFENLINWKMPVVLVEGMFDAITVRRNCIPLLGKIMSDKLKQTLIKTKPPEVYVMLDRDAQKEAMKIEQYLKSFYINVKLVIPTDKDPSDLGFEKSWEVIGGAIKSTFVDLVGTRFNTV